MSKYVGITRLYLCTSADIKKNYQELDKKLQDLSGIRIDRFKVHCRVFNRKSIQNDTYKSQKMYLLRLSENESMAYTVAINEKKLNNNNRNRNKELDHKNGLPKDNDECMILECGIDAAMFFNNIQIYIQKFDSVIEGNKYQIGDFNVSIGLLKGRNQMYKSFCLEIQYNATNNIHNKTNMNQKLFDEFIQLLIKQTDETIEIKNPINDLYYVFKLAHLDTFKYSYKHTALQYVALMNASK